MTAFAASKSASSNQTCNTVWKISWLDVTHSCTPPRLKFKSSTATTLKTAATWRVKTLYPEDGNRLLQDAQCLSLRLLEVTSHATIILTLTSIWTPNLTHNFYTGKKWNCSKSKRTNGENFHNENGHIINHRNVAPLFAKPYEVTRQKIYIFFRLW